MKFIFVRHGTTDWNQVKRLQGQTDTSLNDVGREDAAKLALKLAELKITHIVSSDLKRAHETAQLINATLRLGLAIVLDERLRECSFGNLEGSTKKELETRFGTEQTKYLRDDYGDYDFTPYGGEKRATVLSRYQAVLNQCIRQFPAESNALILGHGRGLGTIFKELNLEPLESRDAYRLYHTH